MATRSIVVRLRAEVDGFKREMAEATKAVDQTAKGTEDAAKTASTSMGRMVQSAKENEKAWTTAGTTLTGFGAATLGGLGLAVKAAMDWQSAFAGVRKTVEASEPEFAALEAGLRSMARELPASHIEIAAVAEAAGQLGIATPNILTFTRTMIDLGEATNMSAEEAATSLARFMNVMGTSQADVGRLGASIVGLGNNFATTESEIVAMAQRLSGAGAQANLTEGDVMGIAAAMSSVGIEAEAGGSAMSQTMKRIGKAVDEGGDKLDLFAQVSGMSAEQFATAWKTDPAMALDAFINGLSGVEAQGMTTNGVLADLGITGIRESDALLRLSAAASQGADGMSLMAEAVQMGNAEFELGMALIEEASQRYETAESRVAMARNAFVDAGISIGSVFLPAVAEAADGVAELAGWFADLPAPLHATLGGLAGVAGAASLGAGSFLLLFPRVMDTVGAFKTLAEINPRLASGMGRVGRAAGVAGAAFVALSAAAGVAELFSDTAVSADEMASRLANLSATAEVTAEDIDELVAITGTGGASVSDFGSALDAVNWNGALKGLDFVGSAFGLFDSDVSLAKEQIASLDQVLSTFAMAGTMDHLANTFNAAVDSASEFGYTAEDVIAHMPGLRTALEPIATEMGLTADNATLAKIATGELVPVIDETTGAMSLVPGAAGEMADGLDEGTGAAEEQVSALEALQEALQQTADVLLGVRGSEREFYESIDSANELIEENGKVLKKNGEIRNKHSEEGRASQAALDGIAQSTLELTGRMVDQQAAAEDIDDAMRKGRDAFIETATAMGMGSEEAERLADELQLIPDYVKTEVEVETEKARAEWDALWKEQELHPPQVPVGADTDPAKDEVNQFSGTLGDMPPGAVPVDADTSRAQEEVHVFGSRIGDVPTTPVIIDADSYYGTIALGRFVEAVDGAGGTVDINGQTLDADAALAVLVEEINRGEGYVSINGTPVDAETALLQLIAHINGSGGTVEIDADKVPAVLKTGEVKRQIDDTSGTVDINGDPSGANAATDGAKRKADGTTGTMNVHANTGSAESSINSTARPRSSTITANATTWSAENQLNWLARNRTSTVTVRTSGGVRAQLAYATGGPVFGPGTATSDSIHAMLSNGEHVLTAAEVALAGGHDSIFRMRSAIRAGALRFADGGGVEAGGYASAPSMVAASASSQRLSAEVDSRVIAGAVTSAMSAWQPMVQIGDREFVGVMRRAGRLGAR